MQRSLSGKVRHGYAIGGLATGSYGTVPGLLLLPYLTDVLGVGGAVAGLIIFVPKAWDFFANPMAGRLSDRSHHRGGRRRAFIIRAGILMALGFSLMFFGPASPPALAAVWVLLAFLATATAYAFFQVPFLAMSAEMTDDYAERTRLMTWRVIWITLAIMISGATAPMIVNNIGGQPGYQAMGIWISVLILAGTLLCWWLTRDAPLTRTEEAGGTLGEQLKIVVSNPHLRTVLSTFVLQAVATSMLLAGVAYMAKYVLNDPAQSTNMFVAFVGPAILVSPLWERLGIKRGKKSAFMLASVVLLVTLSALIFVSPGQSGIAIGVSALVGVAYAGVQLLPLAMLPDIATEDAKSTGTNRIGMLSGVWAGFELLGFALGPQLFGLALSLGGYVPSTGGAVVDQPDSALWAIRIAMSLVPAVLVAISLFTLRKYRLDDQVRAA